MFIKQSPAFNVFYTFTPFRLKKPLVKAAISTQKRAFKVRLNNLPPQHDLKPAGTHGLNEAMHGVGYGAGVG